MAEQLKEFPRKTSRWDEFLDGKVWKLSLEETGHKSMAALRSSITNAAKTQNLRIRTTRVDEDHLVIQVYE